MHFRQLNRNHFLSLDFANTLEAFCLELAPLSRYISDYIQRQLTFFEYKVIFNVLSLKSRP